MASSSSSPPPCHRSRLLCSVHYTSPSLTSLPPSLAFCHLFSAAMDTSIAVSVAQLYFHSVRFPLPTVISAVQSHSPYPHIRPHHILPLRPRPSRLPYSSLCRRELSDLYHLWSHGGLIVSPLRCGCPIVVFSRTFVVQPSATFTAAWGRRLCEVRWHLYWSTSICS